MTTLGREIKKARAGLGWKQQDLQAATGISQKYLSRVENDKADPSFSMVLRIAHALQMDLNVLTQDTEVFQAPASATTPPESAPAPTTPKAKRRLKARTA